MLGHPRYRGLRPIRFGNAGLILVDVAAFRAVRYESSSAGDPVTTSAPAYDDVEPTAFAQHRTSSPYTVLELVTAGADGYRAAGQTYDRWRRTGILVEDPEPCYFRYEEHELRRGVPAVQRGLLAAVAVTPLEPAGPVAAHEQVHPERVAERLARLRAVPVDVAPVHMLLRHATPGLHGLLDRPPPEPPLVAFTDDRGIDHRVWRLSDPRTHEVVRAALRPATAVIADGHHRYAAALEYRAEHAHQGPGPWDRTLAYLVDAEVHGPRALPVHRLVDQPPEDLLDRLQADFVVSPVEGGVQALLRHLERGSGLTFGLRTPGQAAHLLRARDAERIYARLTGRPAWRDVAPAVVEHAVLAPLGVGSERIRAEHDPAAIEHAVEHGDSAALLVRPVAVRTVVDMATVGQVLPPKSTRFEPKPRAGLVMRAAR